MKAVSSRKKKVASFCILWVLVFAVAETGLRVISWIKDDHMRVRNESLDSEWKWAKTHLREGNGDLGADRVYDPLLGWKNPPNLSGPDVQTNSQGMRNHEEFSEQPVPGRTRLIFAGDSFTWGYGVRNEELFTTVIANEYLPEWDVLNMAGLGAATDQQLVTYLEYGRKYHPDIVILGFYVDVYRWNLLSFRSYFKPFYAEEEGEMRLQNSHIIPPQQLFEEYESGARAFESFYDSHLVNLIARKIGKGQDKKVSSSSAMGWKVLEHLMEQFQQSVLESGATPVWMILPARELLEPGEYEHQVLEDLVEAKCDELGMLCLGMGNALLQAQAPGGEALYRPEADKGHFSVHGHQVVAKTIYEYLTETELLK